MHWHNHQHKHSKIALFSPTQVHDDTWRDAWKNCDTALQRYFHKHPEIFHARPRTPAPAEIVGINLPEQEPLKQTA
ncbi:hypothetical protein ACTXPS_19695 [Brachybacterium tyrofermentans]|uniref:hypothetical protein n=1 Tax=Brachybacterium tyrofermentans TaxID=47848 RepID=UPI003FD15E1B